MEAAGTTSGARSIEGEKAQRIVDAMRDSVARRGVAGSTFDHVAREAGVSRGLLHYYFGTKEKLLSEVVKRDFELRMAVLDEQLATAQTAGDFIAYMRRALEDWVHEDPEFVAVTFELFVLSRRNVEIGEEFGALSARLREHVGGLIARKQQEGVLQLRAEPEVIADVLFALADGIAMRMLAEPAREFAPTIDAATAAVRSLLTDR